MNAPLFNPDEHEDQQDLDPIPANTKAIVVIDQVEDKSKDGKRRFAVVLQIVEGQYKGRKLWESYCISGFPVKDPKKNPNKIGGSRFKQMVLATGHVGPVEGFDQLLMKPFRINIGRRTDRQTGDIWNTVKKAEAISGDVKKRAAEAAVNPTGGPTTPSKKEAAAAWGGDGDDEPDFTF